LGSHEELEPVKLDPNFAFALRKDRPGPLNHSAPTDRPAWTHACRWVERTLDTAAGTGKPLIRETWAEPDFPAHRLSSTNRNPFRSPVW